MSSSNTQQTMNNTLNSLTPLAASSTSLTSISAPPGRTPAAQHHPASSPTATCAPKEPAREKLPKLLDAGIGIFACADCGGAWSPLLQTGGRMPRGYRVCPSCGQLHARA